MLQIKDLKAKIDNKEILKGLNLEIKQVKFMLLWDRMDLVKAHCQMFFLEKKAIHGEWRYYIFK